VASEHELREELARLDATILVLERIERLSEQAQRDLDAQRARRAQVAAALDALRGDTGS
jgi:protein-L-isoaspartate O-methyltransferase